MRDETVVQREGARVAILWSEMDVLVDRWDQLSVREMDAVLHRLLARNNLLPGHSRRRAAAGGGGSGGLRSLQDFSRRLVLVGTGAGFGTSERV